MLCTFLNVTKKKSVLETYMEQRKAKQFERKHTLGISVFISVCINVQE